MYIYELIIIMYSTSQEDNDKDSPKWTTFINTDILRILMILT
jgi:hypothetical protein